ncbi:MAG: hypothetical protein ACREXW_03190 [Gammaproteobacteria bacterium]
MNERIDQGILDPVVAHIVVVGQDLAAPVIRLFGLLLGRAVAYGEGVAESSLLPRLSRAEPRALTLVGSLFLAEPAFDLPVARPRELALDGDPHLAIQGLLQITNGRDVALGDGAGLLAITPFETL